MASLSRIHNKSIGQRLKLNPVVNHDANFLPFFTDSINFINSLLCVRSMMNNTPGIYEIKTFFSERKELGISLQNICFQSFEFESLLSKLSRSIRNVYP